jgi:hypothetical protein
MGRRRCARIRSSKLIRRQGSRLALLMAASNEFCRGDYMPNRFEQPVVVEPAHPLTPIFSKVAMSREENLFFPSLFFASFADKFSSHAAF